MKNVRHTRNTNNMSVFISYSQEDKLAADFIAAALKDLNLDIWSESDLEIGERWINFVDYKLKTKDFFLALLSSTALKSQHFQNDVLRPGFIQELADRSISVIPVILDEILIPDILRNQVHIDLKDNRDLAIKQLQTMLSPNIDIDFNRLSYFEFERLVSELLFGLGYEPRSTENNDSGFDLHLQVPRSDPFGQGLKEEWLIQVKHSQPDRLSVNDIRNFAARSIEEIQNNKRAALVTSAQLTSPAREIAKRNNLRLVEGTELKQIVLGQPDVAKKFFSDRRL